MVGLYYKKTGMEKYNLTNDVKVFGTEVKIFPGGIGEAFDELVKMLGGFNRSFYGISKFDNGKMVYYAAAEETFPGEAGKYDCKTYTIEKGEYLTEIIKNWRSKTECIKDVFQKLIDDDRVDNTKPAVEWYKNDDEMLCMVQTTASVK
jgi:predicted transcriptional regulator YdeE